MPSSLTRVFPRTLGFSPRLPVSVYGTGGSCLARSFSWQCGIHEFVKVSFNSPSCLCFQPQGFPLLQHTHLDALFQPRDHVPSCVAPSLNRLDPVQEFQPVVHRLRFSPRLRSRLTLSRRSLLRNPRAFGGKDSHLSFRYSYRHSHFLFVHMSFRSCFFLIRTLPYP